LLSVSAFSQSSGGNPSILNVATAKSSIAGRAHGATPKAPEPLGKRFYPQIAGKAHEDVTRAITTAFDYLHQNQQTIRDLQAQVATLSGAAETAKGGSAGGSQDSKGGGKPAANGFTDNLQGLKIKAVTDSSSLQNGMSLKWNSTTAQWEPSM
jgi:hypothetical protein